MFKYIKSKTESELQFDGVTWKTQHVCAQLWFNFSTLNNTTQWRLTPALLGDDEASKIVWLCLFFARSKCQYILCQKKRCFVSLLKIKGTYSFVLYQVTIISLCHHSHTASKRRWVVPQSSGLTKLMNIFDLIVVTRVRTRSTTSVYTHTVYVRSALFSVAAASKTLITPRKPAFCTCKLGVHTVFLSGKYGNVRINFEGR